jgi:YHS domain-containing protein
MLKNIILGLMVCVVMLTAGRILLAGSGGTEAQTSDSLAIEHQEVGNKICPVSGEQINEGTKATYEYQGKIYNLCCSACIEEFKNNPKKYIQKVDEEMKNNQSVAEKQD